MEKTEKVIDDLVILGRAVPEEISGGRITVCAAGYSPSNGFIRIYPTTYDSPLKRWTIVRIPVEKNPRDNRKESWKIVESRRGWNRVAEKIEVVGALPKREQLDFVIQLVDGCVNDINKAKRSLGIIQASKIIKTHFKNEPKYDARFQKTLFGDFRPTTKKEFPHIPYIKYRCSECKTSKYHDQQLLEWGVFEWLRKHPNKEEQIWDNLGFNTVDMAHFFFVGNQLRRRPSFLIISVLRFKKKNIQSYLERPSIQMRLE